MSFRRKQDTAAALGQRAVEQNSVAVEISGWQGASKEDLVSFLSRKTRILVLNSQIEGDKVVGFVKSAQDADALVKWSGVRFAGDALRIAKRASQQTSSTIELLKKFLYRRYNQEAKLLDLTNIATDVELQQNGVFSSISTQSKMFPALMKLASQENFTVESVSLSQNNLSDLSGVTTLAQTYPNLINLSISDNQLTKLSALDIWKNKFKKLRELILANNPISADPNYKNEVLKVFPKVILLDGITIRDEQKLNLIYKLPVSKKQFFFEDAQIQEISTQFLSNFLQFWDNDRSQLLQLYQPESQFSLSMDSSVPNDSPASNVSFGYYIPISRNLSRVSSEKSRQQRLGKGQEQIYKLFQQIPKTKHTLTESPNLYSVESWRFPQVNGFILTLHGSFDEVAKPEFDSTSRPTGPGRRLPSGSSSNTKLTPKSFDRTFVIVPTASGLVIASDLLIVRPLATADAWNEDTLQPPPPSATSAPQSQSSHHSPAPSTPTHLPTQGIPGQPSLPNGISPVPSVTQPDISAMANSLQLPPTIQPAQREIVARLLIETKLNLQFTLMLAEQSGWDYANALASFTQSHSAGQIPPQAFQQ
jgi:nuclear RNA export factor